MSGNAKFRRFFLTLAVLFFLTASAIAETLNNTSSLVINKSDVVTGTGFLFSSSDYVITSYHVIHGAKSIRVRLLNGEKIDATVALKDTNDDIAILKLSQPPTSRQNIITLGDSSLVKTGDRVFTYGFPLVDLLGDAEPRYSEGFINSLSGISNDPRLFHVSIPIQPGNSGGPVFNEQGELIGIATSSIDSDQTKKVFGSVPQNVNFVIKSSYIKSMLTNLPDSFVRDKGIIVVPTEELGFKERVKNDIVLIEAVPEFKPIVAKKDYEEEERLRRERDISDREQELLEIERQVQEDEQLMMEKEIVAGESELLEREQWIEQRERELVKRERRLQARETKLRHRKNRKVRRNQSNRNEIRERKLGHQQKRKVRRNRKN
jgi:S1-C subfamily serine protease